MGPKTNDECPYKKKRGHGRADVKTEAEIRATRQGPLEPPAAERGRKNPRPEPEGVRSSKQKPGTLQTPYKAQGSTTTEDCPAPNVTGAEVEGPVPAREPCLRQPFSDVSHITPSGRMLTGV